MRIYGRVAMAKGPKKKGSKQGGHGGSGSDPLAEATALFARGDYAQARMLLADKADDADLPEGQRELARELSASTRLERGTLWVGLACLGLLLLVFLVTALTQP